jgi:hypothetical protein
MLGAYTRGPFGAQALRPPPPIHLACHTVLIELDFAEVKVGQKRLGISDAGGHNVLTS